MVILGVRRSGHWPSLAPEPGCIWRSLSIRLSQWRVHRSHGCGHDGDRDRSNGVRERRRLL